MAFREISTDQKLITLVEEYPSLYNKRDKTYKDENEKNRAWLSVAKRMNMDEFIVRKRWDNLRDRFVRAYRCYTDNVSSSGDTEKEIKFPLFFQMMWLGQFIRRKKIAPYISSRSIQIPKSGANAGSSRWPEYFNEDDPDKTFDEEDPIKDIKSENSSNLDNSSKMIDVNNLIRNTSMETPPPKKMKCDSSPELKNSTVESSCVKRFERNLNSDTDSSDFNFMMSIVADMKNLKKKEKIKFKREVLELLEKFVD